jgi:hypothetical protein
MMQRGKVNLLVFDPNQEVVEQWIKFMSTE